MRKRGREQFPDFKKRLIQINNSWGHLFYIKSTQLWNLAGYPLMVPQQLWNLAGYPLMVPQQDKVRPWLQAHHLQGIEKTGQDTHKWTGKGFKKNHTCNIMRSIFHFCIQLNRVNPRFIIFSCCKNALNAIIRQKCQMLQKFGPRITFMLKSFIYLGLIFWNSSP